MRAALVAIALAACGHPRAAAPVIDAPAPGADAPADAAAPPADAATPLAYGERCGNGLDDDGDGLVDEDCPPSLFAGVYAPAVAADPALAPLEAAAGRPLAVLQTYHSTSAAGVANIAPDLAAIFARGQVAHLNVEPSGYTAAQYAAPASDPVAHDLAAMADAVAGALAAAPRGRVILTFGAEMNGNWTDWGCLSASEYIARYRAFHDAVTAALDARGVDHRRVRWAYGPNATSSAACGSAAGYYPGHAYVDFLGMSAYRPDGASLSSAVVAPMSALFDALEYPEAWRRDRFLILQTGARAAGDRAAWIASLFEAGATDDRIGGLIYFDAADWAAPTSDLASGLAMAPVADAALDGLFAPHFVDVPYAHPAFWEIQALRDAEITNGCAAAPARFCPDDHVTAQGAAALLAKAFPGTSPSLSGPVTEHALADAVTALGGTLDDVEVSDVEATRARAAVIIAHGARLRPHPL